MNKTFHHGKLDSPRVKKVHEALARHGHLTTMEIAHVCQTTRPASDISELRACGIGVNAEYVGTENGRKIYRYRLVESTIVATIFPVESFAPVVVQSPTRREMEAFV